MSTDAISKALDVPMQLGECPIWSASEHALYWIDIPGQRVHRLRPQSNMHDSWAMPAEPGCIAFALDGRLLVALRPYLAMLDTNTGELTPIADAPYDTKLMRFNDGRCDAAGRLWVGALYEPRDQAAAPLYRVERGNITDSGKRATVSNGLAFSPDNRVLYHADTTAHRISAYDFDLAAGTISNGRVFQQFSMDKANNYGGRPDGAAVDREGAYWCAMFEGGRLLRFAPTGELLQEVLLPVRCPTMMAFGGEDLRTLYITSARCGRSDDELRQYPLSGYLLSMRVDVPGLHEHHYVT